MKLCSKCKKRPAVVFLSDMSNPNAEPNGLCLVCAKELGIKPVDDMLKKMNISDEDIEQMSEQFMDLMSFDEDSDDAALNDETFDVEIPLPGEHMVMNALAATCVGDLLGLKVEEIAEGIQNVKAVGGRSNLISLKDRVILDDCYNANPLYIKTIDKQIYLC